jgi:NAD(P)-dependent dehydrogenase (short-subunit alcohol dehydrogenase family)
VGQELTQTGELAGKVALVTGGGAGIGRAASLRLAQLGASIAVVDRDGAAASTVAKEIEADGGTALALVVDLSQPADVTRTVAEVIDRFGRIDILVNNAGVASDETLLDQTLESWEFIQAVNLRAPFMLIQAVGRHMVERGGGGKIVNLSSSSAFRGERSNASYGASKAGIGALTRTAAAELGRHDVNVNAVAPGLTRTQLTEPYIGGRDDFQAAVATGPLANLLGRHSEPEDVANVIVFLCTDAARQVTGQIIHTSAGAVV